MREGATQVERSGRNGSPRTAMRRRGYQIALAICGVAGLRASTAYAATLTQTFTWNGLEQGTLGINSTATWELGSNWKSAEGGTYYPTSNTNWVIFENLDALNVVLTQAETVAGVYDPSSGGNYVLSGQPLTIDVASASNSTPGTIPINQRNLAGTTFTYNTAVTLTDTTAFEAYSFQISDQYTSATSQAGAVNFTGGLTLTPNTQSATSPLELLPFAGGVISVNCALTVGTGNLLVGEPSGGSFSTAFPVSTVNLNPTNGTTTGINTIEIGTGSLTGQQITTNLGTNLTVGNGTSTGSVSIGANANATYQAGSASLNLTGNGITLTADGVGLSFLDNAATTATDTFTFGSNYSGTATNTFTGKVAFPAGSGDQQTYIFSAAANNELSLGSDVISGGVVGGSTSQSLQIAGAGSVYFAGASTYVTPTSFNATTPGTLVVGGSSVIHSGGTSISSGPTGTGTLILTNGTLLDDGTGSIRTIANAIALGGTGTLGDAGSATAGSGLTFGPTSASITLVTPNQFTLTNSGTLIVGNTSTISDVIAGSSGYAFTKAGTGTLILTANNTYAGGTSINAGVLQANTTGGGNSATGSGSVSINNGGVLAGGTTAAPGYVSGTVSVKSGGTITAGSGATSSSTIGTLNTGAQTWNSGGTLTAKFASSNGTSVSSSDKLTMSGLTIGATSGSPFSISVLGLSSNTALTLHLGNSIILADDSTGTSSSFNLADLTLETSGIAAPAGDSLLLATQSDGSGGYDLVVEAAPEPTSALLLGLVSSPLLLSRRRRRMAPDADHALDCD